MESKVKWIEDLLVAKVGVKRQWNNIFGVLRKDKTQPRILYSVKSSLRIRLKYSFRKAKIILTNLD